jgi:hypothetical protein
MADETGTWEALIGEPTGIEHAWAIVQQCQPERAVQAAMQRATQKYGPQDWSRWRFRAEWMSQPVVLGTVYFGWTNGELRRATR